MEVNFGSTYRIPISQPGAKMGKKVRLREFANKFDNKIVSACNDGHARISAPAEKDEFIEKTLKELGYKQYQKFDLHNLNADKIDEAIKNLLNSRNFSQKGKNPPKKRNK